MTFKIGDKVRSIAYNSVTIGDIGVIADICLDIDENYPIRDIFERLGRDWHMKYNELELF